MEKTKESFIVMIGWCALWLVLLAYLQGCTLHIGMDWNGQTAVDNKTYTDKKK